MMWYDISMNEMISNERRVLFLDIDGVLNKTSFGEDMYHDYLAQHRSELVEDDVSLFQASVNALKKIVDSVDDIGIVWSTDWRFETRELYDSWKNPRMWLEKQSWFAHHVIGKTPMKMSSNRFEEIHFWFSTNNNGRRFRAKEWFKSSNHHNFLKDDFYVIKNYAILDDFNSPGMKMYGDHFFNIDPLVGLTNEIANNVIEFLKEDNFNYDDLDWSEKGN